MSIENIPGYKRAAEKRIAELEAQLKEARDVIAFYTKREPELERQLAALRNAAQELMCWGVELDDERLKYIAVQVDRRDVDRLKRVLANLPKAAEKWMLKEDALTDILATENEFRAKGWKSPEEWTKLLDKYEKADLEAWELRQSVRQLRGLKEQAEERLKEVARQAIGNDSRGYAQCKLCGAVAGDWPYGSAKLGHGVGCVLDKISGGEK